jgi:tetratricopeptide (TPR) repeat protein
LGIAYCVTGETDRAQKTAEDAVTKARANAMTALTVQALVKQGSVQLCLGHNDEAEKYMTEGLALAQRFQAKTAEANALLSLASVQVQIGGKKNDEGIRNAQGALALYETLGGYFDEPLSAKLVLARGSKQKGDYASALNVLDDLVSRVDPADYDRRALIHEEKGAIKSYQEKYPEALADFRLSLQANLDKKDHMGEGFSRSFIGGVLWHLGRYEEASQEFELALGIARGPDGYPNIQLEVETQQMEEALSRRDFSRALKLATSVLSSQYLTPAHSIRAKRAQALVALSQGKTTEAHKRCDEAIKNAVDVGDPALLYTARSSLALVLLDSQDAAAALKTITEDLNQLVSKDQKESLWQAYLLAARASQDLGDIESARKYASACRGVLASIQQNWGEQDYLRYVKRSDVYYLLGQLNKLPA